MERKEFLRSLGTLALMGVSTPALAAFSSVSKEKVSFSHVPRWRGFNLLEKFTHKPGEWMKVAPVWGMSNEPFRKSDFEWIAEFGFDYVRLPMSYKCWTDEKDWYSIREDIMQEIDQAVAWGQEYKLHVCINFHRAPGYTINDVLFDPAHKEAKSLWDDEEALDACAFHWRMFAERYKGVSSDRLSFNLLNEPVGTTREKHNAVIRRLVGEIREADPGRLILIDGFQFAPSFDLIDLDIAQCPRGYAPGQVTHYKATWAGVELDQLPEWPMREAGGILYDRNYLQANIIPWQELERKGAGIHVGEWGCHNQTPHDVVLRWMKDNLEVWQQAGWGWALWCFRGPFGIIDSNRKDVKYEDFRGHKLDRKMLELLQKY
jgi:endoglucanase